MPEGEVVALYSQAGRSGIAAFLKAGETTLSRGFHVGPRRLFSPEASQGQLCPPGMGEWGDGGHLFVMGKWKWCCQEGRQRRPAQPCGGGALEAWFTGQFLL